MKLAIEGDGTQEKQGHLAPGVNIRVITPTAIPINVEITVSVVSTDLGEAKAEVERIVTSYVNNLAINEKCIVSEMITKVMALNYVKDVAVVSPSSNVEPSINQIARVGAITVNLVEVE